MLLGASSLIRYEAWIFCFLFALREIYLGTRHNNILKSIKNNIFKILIISWGIIAILLFKLFTNDGLGNVKKVFEHDLMSILSLMKIVVTKINNPNIILFLAVFGIIFCVLSIRKKEKRSLWFVILLFLLIDLIAATILISKYPSCYRVFLIANAMMTLFASLGIYLIYILLLRGKKAMVKKIFYLFVAITIFYIILFNLNSVKNEIERTYRGSNFDEYYATSEIIKDNYDKKILLIEPQKYGNLSITSIYLDKMENIYIYPSLNYSKSDIKQLFEKNNFSMIIKIGHSKDNINGFIEDMDIYTNI